MTITPQTNCSLEQLADALRPLDDFVICGHVSPDGDCLGSQLGLAAALRQLGKRVTCVLVKDEPIEENLLQLLPGAADMVPACEYDGPVGAFVGVDVPTRERIGQAACGILDRALASFTIDHHAVDERMCEMAYVDPDAASTTLLIWELSGMLGVSRSGDLVTCCIRTLMPAACASHPRWSRRAPIRHPFRVRCSRTARLPQCSLKLRRSRARSSMSGKGSLSATSRLRILPV